MPTAGPLMMTNAGKDIPPVLGNIAQSFAPPVTAPLMMANAGKGSTPAPITAAPEALASMQPPVSYDPRDLNSKDAMLLPHFANKGAMPRLGVAPSQGH